MRVRNDDHRQAERARFGERRGSGTADQQVSGDQGVGHLRPEERVGAVPNAPIGWQILATPQGVGVVTLAGHVQDRGVLDQRRESVSNCAIQLPHGLRPAKHE